MRWELKQKLSPLISIWVTQLYSHTQHGQSRAEALTYSKGTVLYNKNKALGNGSTNISLCHAPDPVQCIGILLETHRETRKRAAADHYASSKAPVMELRPVFYFFFLSDTGQTQGTERSRGRNATSTKPHKASFSFPLWPFHQVSNCLWQNSLAETL